MLFNEWSECAQCGDEYPSARKELGYKLCLWCGEDQAKAERASWCVIMESGKSNYQFVTAAAARKTLLDTNQKQPRS